TLVGTIKPENFEGERRHFSVRVEDPHPNPLPGYRERGNEEEHVAAIHLRIRIADARVWWPNGLGEPNLYRLKLSIQPEGNGDGDFCTSTFGLQSRAMAPLPCGERRSLYNWTFVINGRPTFLKGTGWCTMDSSM